METAELKKRIRHYVETADERLLNIINAIIEEDEQTIVAHTVDGKPLTEAAYKNKLEASKLEIERGEVISQEDLEKEIEK